MGTFEFVTMAVRITPDLELPTCVGDLKLEGDDDAGLWL